MGSAGAVVPNPRNGVLMSAPERNGNPGYWVSPLAIRYGHLNVEDMAVTALIWGSDRQAGPASTPPGQRCACGSKWQPPGFETTLSLTPSRPSHALMTPL